MAKKKTVETPTQKKVNLGVDIDDVSKSLGFSCRHDEDGYTLFKQHDLMEMRIYLNKDLDLVRYTTFHTYPTTSEYITARNIFRQNLVTLLDIINGYKNGR